MDKRQEILKKCQKHPKKVFWILTTDNFRLAKEFFGDDFERSDARYWAVGAVGYTQQLRRLILKRDPLGYMREYLKAQEKTCNAEKQ